MKSEFLILASLCICLWGCAPTVALQAPDKPFEINMNVKIDHQISVRVDKQIDEMLKNNKEIF